nr:hypothetical protein [Escherichia coli]
MKILERLNNTELELSGLNRWLGKKTFRRTTFYESLAGMIRDGTPVMRALEFICDVETDFGKRKGSPACIFWRQTVSPAYAAVVSSLRP